jgi:hypothetical protein
MCTDPEHSAPARSRPIGVRLRIWDGSRIEVAAATDRIAVVGSYVAAAINDLPRRSVPAPS